MKNLRHTPHKREVLNQMAETIKQTLADFDVVVDVVLAVEGARNYHFHLKAIKPVRMRAMQSFDKDLCYALGCERVEIEAPIVGKPLIGISIPKKDKPPLLHWRDAVRSKGFLESDGLTVPLGEDEFGVEQFYDLSKAPHLLIAGATGSGKTMILHSFLNSLLLKYSPIGLRMILVDMRQAEMSLYNEVPHVLTPVVDSARKAMSVLKWLKNEMNCRYDILEKYGVPDIAMYHKKIDLKHTKKDNIDPMPYILTVIDEMADLAMVYPGETESTIIPLLQMSRAVGIHLVISTQRPSVNVITGMVKANIASRMALQVVSNIDSRTILDRGGAEKLNGPGDMLLMEANDASPRRFQSYSISESEIRENVKKMIKKYGRFKSFQNDKGPIDESDGDFLYDEVKSFVITHGKAATSFIQRKFGIGYSRAAKLMDMLEEGGIIGPSQGSSPRKVIKKD